MEATYKNDKCRKKNGWFNKPDRIIGKVISQNRENAYKENPRPD